MISKLSWKTNVERQEGDELATTWSHAIRPPCSAIPRPAAPTAYTGMRGQRVGLRVRRRKQCSGRPRGFSRAQLRRCPKGAGLHAPGRLLSRRKFDRCQRDAGERSTTERGRRGVPARATVKWAGAHPCLILSPCARILSPRAGPTPSLPRTEHLRLGSLGKCNVWHCTGDCPS